MNNPYVKNKSYMANILFIIHIRMSGRRKRSRCMTKLMFNCSLLVQTHTHQCRNESRLCPVCVVGRHPPCLRFIFENMREQQRKVKLAHKR